MADQPTCQLCGEPMPAGEEMFNYHGYSGPCPKPRLTAPVPPSASIAEPTTEAPDLTPLANAMNLTLIPASSGIRPASLSYVTPSELIERAAALIAEDTGTTDAPDEDVVADRDELTRARVMLNQHHMGGIFDEFRDLPDAIDQMCRYIEQLVRENNAIMRDIGGEPAASSRVLRSALTESSPAVDDETGKLLDGVSLIAAERKRQMEAEGYTPEHDDQYGRGQMAVTAACYAAFSTDCGAQVLVDGKDAMSWGSCKDKRMVLSRERQLVIAGALIAAEIDRLNRAGLTNAAARRAPESVPEVKNG